MKHLFLFFTAFFCFQIHAQSLELLERGNKIGFTYDEQSLSNKELRQLLKTHKASWVAYRKIERKNHFALLVAIPSATVVGYELGRWTGGGTPNWTAAGIGVLGTGIGLYLNKDRKKKLKETVKRFNKRSKKNKAVE